MLITLLAAISAVSLSAGRAFAQVPLPSAAPIITSGNLFTALGNLVSTVLLWAGILAFFYVLYGGFLYVTAGPDQSKADGGRKAIINAVIGIIIIALSYVFVQYITGDALRGGNSGGTTTRVTPGPRETPTPKVTPTTSGSPRPSKAHLIGVVDSTKTARTITVAYESAIPSVPPRTTSVDSRYGYTFENIDPGFYTLTIKSDGVACGKSTVTVAEGKITSKNMSCD